MMCEWSEDSSIWLECYVQQWNRKQKRLIIPAELEHSTFDAAMYEDR